MFFKHTDKLKALNAADFFASRIQPMFGDYLIGPAEPVVNRVRNKYIFEILLKLPRDGSKNTLARNHIQQVMAIMLNDAHFKSVHVQVNVDPAVGKSSEDDGSNGFHQFHFCLFQVQMGLQKNHRIFFIVILLEICLVLYNQALYFSQFEVSHAGTNFLFVKIRPLGNFAFVKF